MSETHRNLVRGYALGLFAAASYGTNPLFAIPLMKAGMSAASVLLVRYMFAIPIVAVMMQMRGRSFRVERKQIFPLAALGWIVAFSSLFLYQSYNYIGASIASTLLFIYPIITTVIMAVLYKEKTSFVTILSIIVASVGIVLLYKGDGGGLNTLGVLLVMGSALTYAIYLIVCSRPLMRRIPTLTLTFYVLLFGTMIYLPWLSGDILTVLNQHWYYWLNVLALAFVPTALSFLATSAAVQDVGSTPVAILGVMEPVTAIAFSVTIFGEPLTPRLALGMSLIFVAVTFVIVGQQIVHQIVRVRKMFPSRRRKRS